LVGSLGSLVRLIVISSPHTFSFYLSPSPDNLGRHSRAGSPVSVSLDLSLLHRSEFPRGSFYRYLIYNFQDNSYVCTEKERSTPENRQEVERQMTIFPDKNFSNISLLGFGNQFLQFLLISKLSSGLLKHFSKGKNL
jgi:hypothetical protein